MLILNHNDLKEITKDLENITRAEEDEEYLYANVLSLAVICKFSNLLEKRLKHKDGYGLENTEIIMLMDFIKNNIDKKLTVNELSKTANMSPATLNRRFRDILNTTPMNYVMYCRLQRARELITKNKYSKTEIAQLCGFYDSAHLNKCLSSVK